MISRFTYKKEFKLVSGASLPEFKLSFESYGKLNKAKDNVILICPALTGDAHAGEGGWWHDLIGPNKALDSKKHYIICTSVLGSCKGSTNPASINPKTDKPYGLTFPLITIEDMVRSQKKLLESLNIQNIKVVIGGSMGGMQALLWSIIYAEQVKNCILIASTAKFSPQALAFGTVGRTAITSDPNWQEGDYKNKESIPKHGLAIARMIGHLTYLSSEAIDKKFGRRLQDEKSLTYSLASEFQVESYLSYQGDKFVKQFDANSYLYLSKAMSYFDLDSRYGSLEKALQGSLSRYLILSINSDWLYPPSVSQRMAKQLMRLNKDVTYAEISSEYGHDAFLIEQEKFADFIAPFIQSYKKKGKK
eukprot:COSAG01_NODE_2503_length_7555_cov_3.547881_6_plen_362_part_00